MIIYKMIGKEAIIRPGGVSYETGEMLLLTPACPP
jgi:hypothetical protein